MKVLHIVGEIDGGGVGAVVLNYVRHINKENNEFHILAFEKSDKKEQLLQSEFEKYGCKVIYIEHRNQGYIKHFKTLKTMIQKEKYDIIHCHFGIWSAPYLFIAMITGVKTRIAHSHVTMTSYSSGKEHILNLFKPLLKFTVTDKFACGRDAGRYLWGDNSDFYIMKNAIETDEFKFNAEIRQLYRKKLGIKENTVVIGHIGRFCYQKNQEFIVEIADKLLKNHCNVLFILVGDGEDFEHINKVICEKNLSSSFMLLGLRNDVNSLLQVFDIFILPSRYEGFPVVGVEAQTSGLYTILSDKITSEVDLLDSTTYLSIETGVDLWVKEIEKLLQNEIKINRSVCAEIVKNLGYDIATESENLIRYYQNAIL